MKQEELATKRWIDAVNNDDAVYETFKLTEEYVTLLNSYYFRASAIR